MNCASVPSSLPERLFGQGHPGHEFSFPEDSQLHRRAKGKVSVRIFTLRPGAIDAISLCSLSTNPGNSVVPPVTTTLLSSVAWRSGSICWSELAINRCSGRNADGG